LRPQQTEREAAVAGPDVPIAFELPGGGTFSAGAVGLCEPGPNKFYPKRAPTIPANYVPRP